MIFTLYFVLFFLIPSHDRFELIGFKSHIYINTNVLCKMLFITLHNYHLKSIIVNIHIYTNINNIHKV
jgi:hypothetical protein